jgi:hypothetical protein
MALSTASKESFGQRLSAGACRTRTLYTARSSLTPAPAQGGTTFRLATSPGSPAPRYSSWQASTRNTFRSFLGTPASASPLTPTPTSSWAWPTPWTRLSRLDRHRLTDSPTHACRTIGGKLLNCQSPQACEKLHTIAMVHEDACLSALARVSGAEGLVARQLAAVGGDPVVGEILQSANHGQFVVGVWQPSAERDPQ